MDQFKPGIYIARDSKKVKYGGEDGGSWLSKYSFVEPEDFEKVASKLKSGKTGDRPIYTKLKTYHKDIWNSIQKNFGIKEEKFSLSDIIEIQEEVILKQEGKKIILEKGDRIKVLSEYRDRLLSSIDFLISKGYVETSSSLPNNYTLIPSKGKIFLKELIKHLSIDRFFESKDFFDVIGNRVFVFVGRQKLSDSSISVSTSNNALVNSVSVSHQGIGD